MMYKRFIFLDVDGVLNHQDWYDYLFNTYPRSEFKSWPMNKFHMCPDTVKLLNSLKGAEVIISSSWMYNKNTIEGLVNAGLELPIIDGTIHDSLLDSSLCRGNDIAKWLVKNGYKCWEDRCFKEDGWCHTHVSCKGSLNEIANGTAEVTVHDDDIAFTYVILDDDDDMLIQQSKHFIHIDRMHGITPDDIEKAKEILNICE